MLTGYYILLPKWRDYETKGTEHSYTFVQSKKELLLKLSSDYEKLNVEKIRNKDNPEMVGAATAQQLAIINRMRMESESLNADEIPPSVLAIIH